MAAVAEKPWVRGSVRADASPVLTIEGVSKDARILGWAPDGSRLAMAEGDTIFVVSIPGGAVTAISVSRPGTALTWRSDGCAFAVEVRNAETGAAIREMAVTQTRNTVKRIAYLDDGAVLAVYVAPDKTYTDSETGCTWDEFELGAPAYGEAMTTFFGPGGETVCVKKRYGFEAAAPDGSGLLRMAECRDLYLWAGDKRFLFRNPFRLGSADTCELRRLSLQDGAVKESAIARFESDVRIHASHPASSVSLIEYEEDFRETALLEMDWPAREIQEPLDLSDALSFLPPDKRIAFLVDAVVPGKGVKICAMASPQGGDSCDRNAVRHYWLAFEGNCVYDLHELPGDPYTVTFSPGGEWLVICAPGGGWRVYETRGGGMFCIARPNRIRSCEGDPSG